MLTRCSSLFCIQTSDEMSYRSLENRLWRDMISPPPGARKRHASAAGELLCGNVPSIIDLTRERERRGHCVKAVRAAAELVREALGRGQATASE